MKGGGEPLQRIRAPNQDTRPYRPRDVYAANTEYEAFMPEAQEQLFGGRRSFIWVQYLKNCLHPAEGIFGLVHTIGALRVAEPTG